MSQTSTELDQWSRLVDRLNQAVQTQARETNQFLLSSEAQAFKLHLRPNGYLIVVNDLYDYEIAQRVVSLLERLLSGETSPRSTVGSDQPLFDADAG